VVVAHSRAKFPDGAVSAWLAGGAGGASPSRDRPGHAEAVGRFLGARERVALAHAVRTTDA
jgi:hypothetical protein